MSENRLRSAPVPDEAYPTLVHAHLIDDARGAYLEIGNAIPYAVEIHSLQWQPGEDAPPRAFEPLEDLELPLRLPATPLQSVPRMRRIYHEPPEPANSSLELRGAIAGQSRTYRMSATPYHPAIHGHPIPVGDVAEQLERHPFLVRGEEPRTLEICSGAWSVRGALVVPSGFSLRMAAGTSLRFESDGVLIAYGDLQFEGTQQAPIVLQGAATGTGSTWSGVVVLESERPSRWSHVTVRDTTGILHGGRELTGGVTFYESDVHMARCRFIGTRAEDGLNLVHSTFQLSDMHFENTRSDALDIDFSDGTIAGGLFRQIGTAGGGDGVDVSGGVVTIEGARFDVVSDKALSVGERSRMSAHRIVVEDAGTGAASKDGSRLDIQDSMLDARETAGLMAYTKKPEFGSASIEAARLVFGDRVPPARAQRGSTISIDGRQITPEEIDVDALYETTMKRGGQ
jgi:hypothetical protein